MGEHRVRNAGVVGSSPMPSTRFIPIIFKHFLQAQGHGLLRLVAQVAHLNKDRARMQPMLSMAL